MKTKSRVTLSINTNAWRSYKAACAQTGKTPSYEIERFMAEQTERLK